MIEKKTRHLLLNLHSINMCLKFFNHKQGDEDPNTQGLTESESNLRNVSEEKGQYKDIFEKDRKMRIEFTFIFKKVVPDWK